MSEAEQMVKLGAVADGEAFSREKEFARKLSKAGWHTYRDEESGRVVTNAYPSEREKLEKISGMPCEVVSEPHGEGTCARIGPVRKA